MTRAYDLPHDEQSKLEWVLEALRNVPKVGEVFELQHADKHLVATLVLQDVIKRFDQGELIYNSEVDE